MEWSKLGAAPPPDFPDLRPAEIRLLRALRGEAGGADVDDDGHVVIGDDLPAVGDADRAIRAGLIAFLARAGDARAPTSDRGLLIVGAWIDGGALDLEGAKLRGDLGLMRCRFDQAPILRGAACASIFLDGAVLPGLVGDRLRCSGSLLMRNGFTAMGEVRLLGAQIRGILVCSGATLDGGGGYALNADRARVTGSVFLNAGFTATGAVRLLGAQIGGDLNCIGATLKGGGGNALSADRTRVTGSVFLRRGFKATGAMVFTEARLGAFADELACWPTPGDGPGQGEIGLVGCVYGGVHSKDWDASSRLDWLSRCTIGPGDGGFHPQPYEQLAKVFRESGHPEDARIVLIKKEELQRQSRRGRLPAWGWRRWALALRDGALGVSVRYGHRPLRAFVWLGMFAAIGTATFYAASQADAIKPNSAVVLRSAEWTACAVPSGKHLHQRSAGEAFRAIRGRAKADESQRDCFERQPEAASWPEFNAFVYSLDTLLPIVDLEMQTYWIPDEDKNDSDWWNSLGWWARLYLWLQIAMGWALSLLAVAGFSGLVKSD
ncbi:MAG: hypothetical protein ACJAW4_000940 [Paracoccaceae bacterium]|jgi:hypothetical protein